MSQPTQLRSEGATARHSSGARGRAWLLVAASSLWAARAEAQETTLHPLARVGWSNAEIVSLSVGAGTAWPRDVDSDTHFRLAGGGGAGLGGVSAFVEAGLCKAVPDFTWCAGDVSLGAYWLRTFDLSLWPRSTFVGLELGGQVFLAMFRVGLFRDLSNQGETRLYLFSGLGWP